MNGSLISIASGNASAVQRFIAAFGPHTDDLHQAFRAVLAAIFDEAIGDQWWRSEAFALLQVEGGSIAAGDFTSTTGS